jgi:hypothetical protein
MAGTIPLSLTQQFDVYGDPLDGGQLYLIQAGTVSTPQNGFQDPALSNPMPNPIPLDASGRIPQFFLADGYIKVRLQDKNGVVQLAADNILVIGPSAGGGGGGTTIDPTTVMSTGDMKFRYDTAILAGFVRCNGRTIGSTTSGATEFADPSAQALFQHLWQKDATLAVTPGGRGTSASADWAANKQIATPDFRGCVPAGLDDMGATAAGRLTTSYFGVVATGAAALGAMSGNESNTLVVNTVPSLSFSGNTGNDTPDHAHGYRIPVMYNGPAVYNLSGSSFFWIDNPPSSIPAKANTDGASARHQHPFSGSTSGGGLPHANCQPTKLITFYLKL